MEGSIPQEELIEFRKASLRKLFEDGLVKRSLTTAENALIEYRQSFPESDVRTMEVALASLRERLVVMSEKREKSPRFDRDRKIASTDEENRFGW